MPVRTATGGAKEPEEEKPSVFGTFMSELKKGVSEQKELKEAADKIEAAAADARYSWLGPDSRLYIAIHAPCDALFFGP